MLTRLSQNCEKGLLASFVARITGTLREDLSTWTISRWVLLRSTNYWGRSCGSNRNILCSITFLSQKSCRLCENVDKIWYWPDRQDTDDNIIRRACFARRIPKATDTHSEYVILIAFSLQQWLRERPSVFRYSYTACLHRVQPLPELVYFPLEIKRPKREATRSAKLTKVVIYIRD
jgi:hypothetical protein